MRDTYGVDNIMIQVMTNPNMHVTFTAGNNGPGTNAFTTPYTPSTIELQTSYLSTASDLSVVRTILHESIHAYFVYAMQNSQSDQNFANLQYVYTALYDSNGSPQNDQNLAQHTQIAETYVQGLTDMLVAYANAHNITSPNSQTIESYCNDLAWAGLFRTTAFINKSQADKDRINNNCYSEQQHDSNSTRPKGCQ
jgi:hypothetical protein